MIHMAQAGYDVHLIAPQDTSFELLPLISWHKWFLKPQSHNPLFEIISFFHLLILLLLLRPSLVFSYTVKANFYCSLMGKILGFKTYSIVTGLGRVFTIPSPLYRFAKRIILWGLQLNTQIWVMNHFDFRYLKSLTRKLRIDHMPGEGVDALRFSPLQERMSGEITHFLFIGRLLKTKGLEELFQAVKSLRQKGHSIHLKIAGIYDPNDLDTINKTQMEELIKQGLVEHLGYVEDVRFLIQQSDCLVLPSYREGLPRVLLEANAMQCPTIVTHVPGCKDIVKEGVNGFLCPPRCSKSLERALQKFMALSEKEKEKLGINGRKMILQNFTTHHVQKFYIQTLKNGGFLRS